MLAPSDPNISVFGVDHFNLEADSPNNHNIIPAGKPITVVWGGANAPNYSIRVLEDPQGRRDPVFWCYVGNVKRYTLPGNLFKEGLDYSIDLRAVNSINYGSPDYIEAFPRNSSPLGEHIYIRTLPNPDIVYPTNEMEGPLQDLTITWNPVYWDKNSGYLDIIQSAKLNDLTTNQPGITGGEPRSINNYHTIPVTSLESGHTYAYTLEFIVPFHNIYPENITKSTVIFKVK